MKKIIKTCLILYLFFGFICCVKAETYALNQDDVKNGEKVVSTGSLVLGTHLITDYSKASTELIMQATKTVVDDEAIIYTKYAEGDEGWINALNGDEGQPSNVNGLICITHVNGVEVSDSNCSSTIFSVKFTGTNTKTDKSITVANGEKILAADIPTPATKKGYEFVCWVKKDTVNESHDSCFDFSKVVNENLELVPYYDLIKYKISFDLNGLSSSTPEIQDQTCTIDDLASPEESNCKLPNLNEARKGYTFDGWSTVKDANGDQGTHFEAEDSMVDMLGDEYNITLYAVWKPQIYDITYNLNGGTYENQTTVKSSYTVLVKDGIELFNPTRTGYTFDGWEVAEPSEGKPTVSGPADGNGKYTLTIGENIGDLTLIAKWKEKEYTITYDLGLDTESSLLQATASDEDLETPGNTTCKFENGCVLADAPNREEFIFAGWADKDGYLYSENKNYSGVDFKDSTIKLTAQWNAKNEPLYTIKYELDGGRFTTEAMDKYGRTTVNSTLPTPEKTGYTFAGWCTDDAKTNGCEGINTVQNVLTNLSKNAPEDITVYAKWTANTYTVKFYEPNDATVLQFSSIASGVPGAGFTEIASSSVECTYDSDCTLSDHEQHFEEKKEKLYGWSLTYGDKNNNNSVYLSDDITVKNLTAEEEGVVNLYAVAEKYVYSLTYYLDGGAFTDEDGSHPESATKDETVTIKNPTRDGYTFEKWVDEAGNDIKTEEGADENSVKVKVTDNMILVAVWKKDYQIDFYLDGGTLDSLQDLTSKKYKEGFDVEINNPTKAGYTFAGWVDKNGNPIKTEESEPKDQNKVKIKVNSDLFLIATWKQNNPEITIEPSSNVTAEKGEEKLFNVGIKANNKKGFTVLLKATVTKDGQAITDNKVTIMYGTTLSDGTHSFNTATDYGSNKAESYLGTEKGIKLNNMSKLVTVKFEDSAEENGNYKLKIEILNFNYPDEVLATQEVDITVNGGE